MRDFILFFSLVIVLLCSSNAVAQQTTVTADPAQTLEDQEFNPPAGTYYYDVFLKGIKVGKAEIIISFQDGLHSIAIKARAKNAINRFYKFKYKGETKIKPSALRPLETTITEVAGKKQKDTQIAFPEENRAKSTLIETTKNKKKISEREVVSDTFILDPFSVFFLVRHLDWHVGMAEIFDVFTGKKHYELRLLCDAVVSKTFGDQTRESWVIIPLVRNVSTGESGPENNFRIYLSTDDSKEIFEIEGDGAIGKMRASLREIVVQPVTAQP